MGVHLYLQPQFLIYVSNPNCSILFVGKPFSKDHFFIPVIKIHNLAPCREWRSPNPPPGGSIILPSQDDGTPNPSQISIQYISPVPPVKKTYEWYTTTALWVPVAHIRRSIVLTKGDMSSNNKPRNLIPRPQGLPDLT